MSSYCDFPLRVRYAETDQMGIAYYANYFVWFEVGRAEFCRQRGFSYKQMEGETESFLVVAEAYCRYHAPLRYDSDFVVRTCLKQFRKRTITFSYKLLAPAGPPTYAEGHTVHVVTDRSGRPKTFPDKYRELLTNGQ